MTKLIVNKDKELIVEVGKVKYQCYAIKTHVITNEDNIVDVCVKYAKPVVEKGDILFISEKAVACTQQRAIPLKDIKPRFLATFLSKYVHKSEYGIGLGMPETMEMALRECGVLKILIAAFISVIGKIFGKSGWFYNFAGEKARSIDGPCSYTLPPYNEYVVLGPKNPDQVASDISKALQIETIIIDINDLGGRVLGTSDKLMDRDKLVRVLADNPLGQSSEQTPMGIIRILDEKNSN